MIGQGLLADPALVQKAKGGPGAGREALRAFHDELYHTYLEIFASQRNTVFHMKELWSYLGRLFQGAEKPLKQIRKAADSPAYEAAVAQILLCLCGRTPAGGDNRRNKRRMAFSGLSAVQFSHYFPEMW